MTADASGSRRRAEPASPPIADPRSSRRTAIAVASWAALIVVAFAIGLAIHPGYPYGWVPPLHAHLRLPAPGVVVPVALGVAAVWQLPRWFDRLGWRALLLASWSAATVWAVALAASDGWSRLKAPLATTHDYVAAVESVGSDPLGWLRDFVALVPSLPTHPSAHPPLPVLIVWVLDRVGLGGAGPAAALCIVVGASAVPAVLVAVRALASEDVARRAAPYLALAPFALTIATCFDALFAGVTAWAVASLALAVQRGSVAWGVGAGALFAAVLYLNYGLLVVGAFAVAVLAVRWRPVVAGAAVAGGLAVLGLFTAAGFWWFDGVAATHAEWAKSLGGNRPYAFTVFGNLAVFGLLVGPATAAATAWVRDRALVALGGAAIIAILALDVAGITRGEVERIWLPMAPWAVVVTAALPARWLRSALLAQVATALAVQMFFRLSW